MFNHNKQVENDHDSRKRKITEVGNTSSDPFGMNQNAFRGNKLLHKPFKSYTALLAASSDDDLDDHYFNKYMRDDDVDLDDHENVQYSFRPKFKGLHDIIASEKNKLHCSKNEYDAKVRAAEVGEMLERRAEMKKLLHDNKKMKELVIKCKSEIKFWKKKSKNAQKKIKLLEDTVNDLVMMPGHGLEEQDESSFVEAEMHETSTWLSCKVCEMRMATMVVWPCNHFCVCRRCDATITDCPLCGHEKLSSIQVHLS